MFTNGGEEGRLRCPDLGLCAAWRINSLDRDSARLLRLGGTGARLLQIPAMPLIRREHITLEVLPGEHDTAARWFWSNDCVSEADIVLASGE